MKADLSCPYTPLIFSIFVASDAHSDVASKWSNYYNRSTYTSVYVLEYTYCNNGISPQNIESILVTRHHHHFPVFSSTATESKFWQSRLNYLQYSIMFSIRRSLPSILKATPKLTSRQFTSSRLVRMAASVDDNSVTSHEDPSVSKQYDNETPIPEQIEDFYKLADANRISLLITNRKGDTVSRAMAVSKREGPDFYYLANINSTKIQDIKSQPKVNISFFNNSDQSWVSISGHATIDQNSPKIKELYNPVVSAWFGDLGDGVHSGNSDDPRMTMVKVKTNRVSYYMSTKGKLARMADMASAVALGNVAQTGVLRELAGDVLEGARAGQSRH